MVHAATKPTIFLHIGTEKTGTSTIQRMFWQNSEAAMGSGIVYPVQSRLLDGGAHFGLVRYVAGKGDCPPNFDGRLPVLENGEDYNEVLLRRLSEEIAASGCSRVLISSEHFSSSLRMQASVDRAIDVLAAISDDIRVVIYFRPQYELFPSTYSTSVKGGNAEPARVPSPQDHFFNYDKMLGLWERAIGRDRIDVRLFVRSDFKGGNFIADFFSVMGMQVPGWASEPKLVNPRLSAAALEFLRIANGLNQAAASEDRFLDVGQLVVSLERIVGNNDPFVGDEILQAIDEAFQESNDLVAARYFPDRQGGLFARFVADGNATVSALTAEQAVTIGMQLWQIRTGRIDHLRSELKRLREEMPKLRAEMRRLRDEVKRLRPAGHGAGKV